MFMPFNASQALGRLGLLGALLAAPLAVAQPSRPPSAPPGEATAGLPATGTTVVGGAAMSPTRDLLDNLQRSQEHLIFVADLKASGLADTLALALGLRGNHEFTVFAPVDAAFPGALPPADPTTAPPGASRALARLVANHIVRGRLDAATLARRVAQGGGQARLTTLDNETLTVTSPGSGLFDVTDARGQTARVLVAGVPQANGSLYVIDQVLEPRVPAAGAPASLEPTAPSPAVSRPPARPARPAAADRRPDRATART